jgi:hypothetical protein
MWHSSSNLNGMEEKKNMQLNIYVIQNIGVAFRQISFPFLFFSFFSHIKATGQNIIITLLNKLCSPATP